MTKARLLKYGLQKPLCFT